MTRSRYLDPATYAATRLPVEQATTLIPDAYRCADFFQFEQERVWSRSWVAVGYCCQLPRVGDTMLAEVAGQSLILVRNRANDVRCYHNVCRHRGSRLLKESGNCKVLRCPYHGWGYSLDGELLGTPYFQGLDVPPELENKFSLEPGVAASFCKDDYPLLSVRCETWGGILFVNLDPEAMPLTTWLGDLPQRYIRHPLDKLQLVRRKDYDIQANWKLIAENFMEYYHLPWGHPELCNISGFDNHYRYQGLGMYTGMCTSPLTNDPNTLLIDLPTYPGLNDTESQSVYFAHVFPNLSIWNFPHHLVTLLFRPDGPTRTLESVDMLVHPDALQRPGVEESLDRIMNFWSYVNEQDVDLVEGVQSGLNSRGYPGGRMCYKFEEPVHRFQNWLIDMLLGEPRIPPGDQREEAPMLKPVTTARSM